MGGPTRSRSRSTTVKGNRGNNERNNSKKRQRYGKKGRDASTATQITWDHDDSSASDSEEGMEIAVAKRRKQSLDGDSQGVSTVKKTHKRPRQQQGDSRDKDVEDPQNSSDGDDSEERSGAEEEEKGSDEDRRGGVQAPPGGGGGGMGDVMARILGQKVDTRTQAPVLAKRKTKAMKAMEEASAKRAESRGKSAARRANMTQQFVIPDHTTTDYERQMKKIATRGVVALFNAISKRQAQEGAGGDNSETALGKAKAAGVKGASRHAFLDMLKTGVKPIEGSAGVDASSEGAAGRGGAGARAAGRNQADEKLEGGRSWSVLKEDYMLGSSSMKNWDQESAESEEDALAGGTAMSDDSD